MTMTGRRHRSPTASQVGLNNVCPRCGEGRLFDGFLSVAARCRACELDYAFADSGDGPAYFIVVGVGIVVGAAALIVEVTYEPAMWVHALLWGPLTVILVLALMRPLKGMMIAQQYRHGARQGDIANRSR